MTGDKRSFNISAVYKYLPHLIVIIFFFFIAFIYLHNLTRDIYSGDIGDLVTASYVCGVAHPPGYPLFTMLGCFLSRLPLPIPPVTKVGLISTTSSLLGLFIYYKFARRISKNLFISLLCTSIVAFSYYFWLHAELPEVFGLNNFFIIALLYLSYMFSETRKDKYLYLLVFTFGLASTHHHTIIFILPSICILILRYFRYIVKSPKRIITILLCGFAGLSTYIYVLVAASFNPIINWDNANNLQNLLHLFLRKDYETFGYGGLPLTARTILLSNYLYSIIHAFSYQIVFIVFLGLISLFRKDKRIFFALVLAFIISGPFFVMYIGAIVVTTAGWGVIERFYIFSSVVLMFFVPYGFSFLREILEKYLTKPLYVYAILGYFIIIPVLLFQSNFPKTNIASTQIGNKFTNDILVSLPRRSILYVNGDTKTFNMWYTKHVLHKRPDIDIINPPGRAGNYFLDAEINKYYKKHPQTKPKEIVAKTLEVIRRERPIYATQPLEQIPPDSIVIPLGMVYKLSYKKDIPNKEQYINTVQEGWNKISPPTIHTLTLAEQNLITPEIPLLYSLNIYEVAQFILYNYKDPARAIPFYKEALRIHDENSNAYAGLAMAFLYNHNCDDAQLNVTKAIKLYPIYRSFYAQQYIIYDKCDVPQKQLTELAKNYQKHFHESLNLEVKKELKRY